MTDAEFVICAHDFASPQSSPDLYTRVNAFSVVPSKIAAGSDVVFSVPNGVMWDVKFALGTLTASAGAANRLVGFFVKDQGGTLVYSYQMTAAVTANLVGTFCFSEDCTQVPTAFATTNSLLLPQPKAWIPSGWTFGTTTLNLQAGDQWSAVSCYVQEWLPREGE